MEVGTQILIERMQTHPEEFEEGKISKWARHVSYAMEWLPEEDKQALREAIEKRRIAQFNENVLKELAGDPESEVEETVTYKSQGRYSMGWTDPRMTLGSNGSLGIGSVAPKQGMSIQANGDVEIGGNLTVTGKIHVKGEA